MEIESNIDNITSLMIENIDDDRIELKGKVEEAIKILMSQMLVQKNGNLYVFLTDEEQEINNEIEKENVEMSEVITKISEMIFEDIFTEKKYRYPEFGGRYSFSFNQIVDDRPYKSNQTCDIGLRILTPWYDGGMDDATLRMMSGQCREVLVVLPNDDEFLTEMRAYLKIEGFLRKNTSAKLAKYEEIKETKRVEMRERNDNAKLYLTEGLKEATIYVNGDIARLSSKEVNNKIREAIGRLVQTVFHKLSYIDTAMGESDIRKLLQSTNQMQMQLGGGTVANTHALDDVQGYIAMNSRNHMKTSMKSVKDRFMKAPYGFVEDDINWLVACLFKRGDLSFNVNGISVNLNNKSEDDIISYITKKAFVEKLLMEERVRVSEKDKKAVRDVMKEVFNTTVTTEDEDSIMKDFQRSSSNMINEMDKLEVYYKQYDYPGKNVIDTGKRLLKSVIQISGALEFFSYVSKYRETFFDMAEDYEPVKTFFNGEQQNIFKRSLDMLAIYDDSKTYIVDRELEEVIEKMRSILKQDKPYKNIPQLPELRERFMERYSNILEEQSEPVKDSIKQDRSRVLEVLNTKSYKDEKLARYTNAFDELLDGAEQCNNISTLRSFADKADALKLRLLNEMTEEDNRIAQEVAKRLKIEQEKRNEEAKQRGEEVKAEAFIEDVKQEFKVRTTKNISIKTVAKTASWRLESSEDIEKYLAILRENLLKEIKEDTIINIEL